MKGIRYTGFERHESARKQTSLSHKFSLSSKISTNLNELGQNLTVLLFCWLTGVNIAIQPVVPGQSQNPQLQQVPAGQQQATHTLIQATPSQPQTTPQHTLFVKQQPTPFFTAQQQVMPTRSINNLFQSKISFTKHLIRKCYQWIHQYAFDVKWDI